MVALFRTRRERPRGNTPPSPRTTSRRLICLSPSNHELSKILRVNFALFGSTARSQHRNWKSRKIGFRDVAIALAPQAANQSYAAATKKYAEAFGPKLETLTAQLFLEKRTWWFPPEPGRGFVTSLNSRFFRESLHLLLAQLVSQISGLPDCQRNDGQGWISSTAASELAAVGDEQISECRGSGHICCTRHPAAFRSDGKYPYCEYWEMAATRTLG